MISMILCLLRTRFALAAGIAFLALTWAAMPVLAASAADPAAPPPEATAIRKTLEQKFPGASIGVISKSPYFGLYEVQLDNQLVYTDVKTKFVIVGSVYDADSKVNLTEKRMRKVNRVDVASLPLDLAFKRVKGNGERTLIIFSDADCPFCAKLENELKPVNNVTIYTFLYPIDQLHPDSARKSRIIWCSDDKVKSWDAFFASGALPDNTGECDNPLERTHALGEKLKVQATPTLIFADGSIVPGAIPTTQLESEFASAAAEMKKPVAANK
jgi:thiol:disulfide interchange protein DsbC